MTDPSEIKIFKLHDIMLDCSGDENLSGRRLFHYRPFPYYDLFIRNTNLVLDNDYASYNKKIIVAKNAKIPDTKMVLMASMMIVITGGESLSGRSLYPHNYRPFHHYDFDERKFSIDI